MVQRIHVFILLLLFCSLYNTSTAQLYLDITQPATVRAEDLLSLMTLDEKIGQMTQIERAAPAKMSDVSAYFIGSILSGGGSAPSSNTPAGWADMSDQFQNEAMKTRLKIPIIYGIDAVHGNNNVKDAVIFPHNIGLGCTRNPELVKQAAQITASEVIATGLHWTFAPCIAVPRNERWGRTYEGYGEMPDLVTQLGVAAIKGIQGDSLFGRSSVLACAKHYIGDGGTTNGIDQGNTELSEAELRSIHLPGYIEAIKNGVGSIMASYSSWNGQKMHGHKYLLTDVLKTELGFKGFVVSDWAAIDQLPGDYPTKVMNSINAGCDMIMLPHNYIEFTSTLKILVQQGKVTQSRIDDAVKRILTVKFQIGLFDDPFADRRHIADFGSDAHRQVARECVRQSLVLLKKKDNVLPLSKNNIKIHVAGNNADNIGNQCGGWSITWQGSGGNITKGTTILQGIKNAVGSSTVTYSTDGSGVSGSDVAIAVIGETPYAEGMGDRSDLSLSETDINTVRNLKRSGIPVIVVLVSGRPMILNPILHYSDAILAAWLPGTEGEGVADVLFGDYQPSGKLSYTWPKEMQQIPINYGDADYFPLYEYGYGISSLNNSAAGSSPVVLSALAGNELSKIEITFNKTMKDPSGMFSDFQVSVNSVNVNVVTAELKTEDQTTIIITASSAVQKGDKVEVSYSGTTLTSEDGGLLNGFSNLSVYNLMDEKNIFTLPCKIEAEDYSDMFGVQTENTTDTGGGINVGWIETGDWMEYTLHVPSDGNYKFNFRIASSSASGQIKLMEESFVLGTIDLPVTGGWQTWQTIEMNVNLSKGTKTLRVHAGRGGFNLNWIDIGILTRLDDNSLEPSDFALSQNYPNPFNPVTIITYSIPKDSKVRLSLFDILGREIAVLADDEQISGTYSVSFNSGLYNLSSGTYFYKLTADGYTSTKKMTLMK